MTTGQGLVRNMIDVTLLQTLAEAGTCFMMVISVYDYLHINCAVVNVSAVQQSPGNTSQLALKQGLFLD